MVDVMTINLAMNTRLAKVGIVGGRPRWIRTIPLAMRPTTFPKFLLFLLFHRI
jgi:hypothetical protein